MYHFVEPIYNFIKKILEEMNILKIENYFLVVIFTKYN